MVAPFSCLPDGQAGNMSFTCLCHCRGMMFAVIRALRDLLSEGKFTGNGETGKPQLGNIYRPISGHCRTLRGHFWMEQSPGQRGSLLPVVLEGHQKAQKWLKRHERRPCTSVLLARKATARVPAHPHHPPPPLL